MNNPFGSDESWKYDPEELKGMEAAKNVAAIISPSETSVSWLKGILSNLKDKVMERHAAYFEEKNPFEFPTDDDIENKVFEFIKMTSSSFVLKVSEDETEIITPRTAASNAASNIIVFERILEKNEMLKHMLAYMDSEGIKEQADRELFKVKLLGIIMPMTLMLRNLSKLVASRNPHLLYAINNPGYMKKLAEHVRPGFGLDHE